MISLHTNVSNLKALNQYRMHNDGLQKISEQLSTGKRINRASDDAAGLAVSVRMQSRSNGMEMAKRNIMDGISFVNTIDGHLETYGNILQRLREVVVQGKNGTYNESDIQSMQKELNELGIEINISYMKYSHFNNVSSFDGEYNINIHVSDKSNDTLKITTPDLSAGEVGALTQPYDVTSITLTSLFVTPENALRAADDGIEHIIKMRTNLGTMKNRLEYVLDNVTSSHINNEQSKSRILDANMADASSEFAKNNIKSQSSIVIIKKTQELANQALQLLEG